MVKYGDQMLIYILATGNSIQIHQTTTDNNFVSSHAAYFQNYVKVVVEVGVFFHQKETSFKISIILWLTAGLLL